MFQYPGAPGFSNTLPASSLAQGLPLPPPRSFGNSGMLAFPNDPFAACQENKENIPMANQQTRHVGHMLQPDMSRQLLEKTPPGTALDLDDIAAVALLDSLSNGTSRPLAASSSTLSQLLASSSAQPNYSGILYSTTPTLAPIKPVQRFSSLPKKQPDSLGLIPGAGLNSGMPFSNYRLSAVRSPEFTGNPQAPMTTSESMLFGESSRFHPTLRSSSFGLQLNMGAGQAVSDPPVLRMPQHQLYHGPAGDHSSSPYVAGTYEVSPITARLQQTNHASVAQPGYAGTFA
ncbi:hypothetical protein GGF43_001915 [Coemansia sp. RSA 2618]|nr:hypothetical protein GGF43_001915 [Coemansia sp. RSA 2618]